MEIDIAVDDGVACTVDVMALAEVILAAAGLDDPEWSLRLVDDPTMAALNAQWRGKEGPTDVLSFPLQDEGPVEGGVLGDVVISVDTAQQQADERGHDLRTELAVLLAHGLAHLLGHDHHDDAEAVEMAACETSLLSELGVQGGLVERAGVAR